MDAMERALSSLGRLSRRGTARDLSTTSTSAPPVKEYPADAAAYELLEDCGRGVSATVHRAICKPLDEVVAVKKLNLESLTCNLEDIVREAQTMKSYSHPNVLSLYASFVAGEDLYMVTPYMSGGSVLHIMKYGHPEGLSEAAIATIMREVLKGLEYIHKNGGIHRDVKSGNILIDGDGSVKIGDFGVAATIERGGSWGNDKVTRTTFVGTPCWMAPEVMEQTQGYDSSADIWSLGITMLEMANGHAPFAKFPPMKVLLMTLQNPPPSLEDTSGQHHFSKHMRDVVARCLQKDPAQRPTATELLAHKFFKQARDEEFICRDLLDNLPPLSERVRQIRVGGAATNAADNDSQIALSHDEYVKGVSCWNFDLAALKAQAAAEPESGEGSVPQTPTYAPSMPTIVEVSEERTDGDPAAASDAASGPTDAATQARGNVARLVQQAETGSPSATAAAAATPASSAAGMQVVPPPAGVRPLRTSSAAPSVFTSASAAAATAAAGLSTPAVATPQPGAVLPRLGTHTSEPIMSSSASVTLAAAAQLAPAAAAAATAAGGPTSCGSNNSSSGGGAGPGGGAASTAAGSSSSIATTVSPGSASPCISRESSSQGPLSSLATPTAAAVAKQRIKGRFQVYEGDEVPPPMSPPASGPSCTEGAAGNGNGAAASDAAAAAGSGSPMLGRCESARGGADPRMSDAGDGALIGAGPDGDGNGAGASAAGKPPAGPSAVDGDAGAAPEPKMKGRFKIIEEKVIEDPSEVAASRSMSKASSIADVKTHLVGAGLGLGIGSLAARGAGSVTAGASGPLLARLVELADQATAHQAALLRLVDSVRDGSCDVTGAHTPPAGTGSPSLSALLLHQQHLGSSGAALSSPSAASAAAAAASGVPAAVAAALRKSSVPGGSAVLSRTPSNRGLMGATAAATASESATAAAASARTAALAALLRDLNDDAVAVAERLMDRVVDLEKRLAESNEEIARLKAAAAAGGEKQSEGAAGGEQQQQQQQQQATPGGHTPPSHGNSVLCVGSPAAATTAAAAAVVMAAATATAAAAAPQVAAPAAAPSPAAAVQAQPCEAS